MAVRVEIEGLAQLQAAAAKMGSTLSRSLDDALDESGRIVADRAQSNAPRRSGRMAGSVQPFRDGAVAGVRVTARRFSRGYPGGYPYPARIERIRPFLGPAIVQEAPRIVERMTEVLDDVQRQWGAA